jgi:hypothetical protein
MKNLKKITLEDLDHNEMGGAEVAKKAINNKSAERKDSGTSGIELYDEFTGEKETIATGPSVSSRTMNEVLARDALKSR